MLEILGAMIEEVIERHRDCVVLDADEKCSRQRQESYALVWTSSAIPRSVAVNHSHRPGPAVPADIRDLIRTISRDNPSQAHRGSRRCARQLAGFDHRNDKDLVVRGLLIVARHAVHGGADRPVAPGTKVSLNCVTPNAVPAPPHV
jgi:hypothetical protein